MADIATMAVDTTGNTGRKCSLANRFSASDHNYLLGNTSHESTETTQSHTMAVRYNFIVFEGASKGVVCMPNAINIIIKILFSRSSYYITIAAAVI